MICDRYDKNVEKKWQESWASGAIYNFDEKGESRPIYSIDSPPPFTSGDLHMGHVLSYSYFDFVARYKRMRGFNVYYPQGWDCQGFPTETKVESKHGRKPAAEFRKLCVEWTDECIKKMKSQMDSMGFSPDWRYEYRTMTPDYHKRVQYSLLKMHEQQLVYRAEHPVFWCTHCKSALAKTDTEEAEKETSLHHIKFGHKSGDLVIATTRPELLHACVAVLFHPDDHRYAKYAEDEIITPLGKKVKLLPDKDVDLNFGSGLVMVCTFGDKQDIVWMYRHNLPLIRAMDEVGRLVNAGEYDGMKCEEARKKMLEKFAAEGKIVKTEQLKHTVKVHDRCKRTIELMLSTQWFIRLKGKEDDIIGTAKKMRWVPDFGIQYLIDWAQTIEWDWVISRQRVFGTPIPFWYCKKCNKDYPAKYEELPVSPPELAPRKCPDCHSELVAESSTCDCWVDSSITPLSIAYWPENEKMFRKVYPASLRPQGVEIVRTWAFYTIYRCLMLTGKPCFSEILLNGNVLAPDGKKMSKSLGNIIAPDKLIDDYSADAVRQWSALSGAMAKDRPFSYQDIQYAKSFNNKLLNASKLISKSIEGYVPSPEDAKHLRLPDKWVLSRMHRLISSGTDDMENFQFHHMTKDMHDFFWHEVCDYYLEYIKHRLYQPEVFGETSKRAAQYTLYHILLNTLKLLAPIAPHITEEIYQIYEPGRSIHLSAWPIADDRFINEESEKKAKIMNDVITEIRQHKARNKLPLNSDLARVEVSSLDDLSEVAEDLKATGRIKDLVLKKGDFAISFA